MIEQHNIFHNGVYAIISPLTPIILMISTVRLLRVVARLHWLDVNHNRLWVGLLV
jgi:hypothetical protein